MRGNGCVNVLAENKMRANTVWKDSHWRALHKKLCWSCQKESHPQPGSILKVRTGLHKYVCLECVQASQARKAAKTAETEAA